MPEAAARRYALLAVVVGLLLAGGGCAGKDKNALAPPPEPSLPEIVKASSPSAEPSEAEDKPGFFSRMNPFRKTPKPSEEPKDEASGREVKPKEPVKGEGGFISRWLRRFRGGRPATPENLAERNVTTAKGEVSPPPFEYDGLKLTLGETSKARIISTFGKPENVFFSEGAEEILVYRRMRQADSLYIFLDSQGLVKDYIITKKP